MTVQGSNHVLELEEKNGATGTRESEGDVATKHEACPGTALRAQKKVLAKKEQEQSGPAQKSAQLGRPLKQKNHRAFGESQDSISSRRQKLWVGLRWASKTARLKRLTQCVEGRPGHSPAGGPPPAIGANGRVPR